MDADHAGDPSGRRAGVADVHHRGQEVAGVGLVAAEVGRLEHPDDPDVLQALGDVVGEPPELVGGRRSIGELAARLLDPLEHLVAHDAAPPGSDSSRLANVRGNQGHCTSGAAPRAPVRSRGVGRTSPPASDGHGRMRLDAERIVSGAHPHRRLRRHHRPHGRGVRAVVARAGSPRRARAERDRDPLRRPRVLPLRLLRVRPPDPQHRPAGRRGDPLQQLPRHAAVLAHAGRPAHRPEPPHRRHAGDLQLQHRVPPHAGPHHRAGDDDGRGAPRGRLRDLHGGQVAPLPDGRGLRGRSLRQLAAPAGLRPLLRLPRRRDRPVHPRPHLRQPPDRPAAHAGGGLPPHRGPGRPDAAVRQRLGVDPTRSAVLHLPRPRAPPTLPTRRRPSTSPATGAATTTAGTRLGAAGSPASRSSG